MNQFVPLEPCDPGKKVEELSSIRKNASAAGIVKKRVKSEQSSGMRKTINLLSANTADTVPIIAPMALYSLIKITKKNPAGLLK